VARTREITFSAEEKSHIATFGQSKYSLQGLSLSFTVSTRCLKAGTSILTVFRPTRVDTGEVLRSFVSPSLALGLATPWVELGRVLPSVPIFIDPDLSAGFPKHLRLGWMQTWDDGANHSSFGGSLAPQFQQYLASGGLIVRHFSLVHRTESDPSIPYGLKTVWGIGHPPFAV
jgi:hypothetical protein